MTKGLKKQHPYFYIQLPAFFFIFSFLHLFSFYIQLPAFIFIFSFLHLFSLVPVDFTSPRSFFVRRVCTGLRVRALLAILIGFIPFCLFAVSFWSSNLY